MLGDGTRGTLQQTAKLIQGRGHTVRGLVQRTAEPVVRRGRVGVRAQSLDYALQGVPTSPEMAPASPSHEPGDVVLGEPPSAQVNEAAGQHGVHVAEMPAVPRQVQRAA